MWAAYSEEPVVNSTEPTPMDCTLAERSELVSPEAEPTANNCDTNVSASVFTDVDTAVAEASWLETTGEVELGAIILKTSEACDEEWKEALYIAHGFFCNLVVNGRPYHNLYSATQYCEMRDECRELNREELDLVVMGELLARTLCDRITQRSSDRKRTYYKFYYSGHRICLHNISHGRINAI